MANGGRVVVSTELDNSGIKAGMNGLEKSLKKIGGLIAVAFAAKTLLDFGKRAIDLGSSVSEVQNVVNVSFGSMAYKCEEFAKTSITQFGMSRLAAKQTASTYMAMAKSMGLSMDAASDMAINVAKLSGDVASFYNVSQEVAALKLKGIFTGETEALKDLGVVMTEDNLKQYALSQGITRSYSSMSQAEKVALRYNFVMSALSDAQGDFVRTQDSWANQTRILSMQWQEFMSIIGQTLITVLTPAIKFLNTVVSALITAANALNAAISSIFGGTNKQMQATASSAESVSSAIGSGVDNQKALTKEAKKTGKEQSKTLASFDQLNKLSDTSGAGGGSGSGGGGAGAGSIAPAPVEVVSGEEMDSSASKITKFFEDLNRAIEPTRASLARLWEQLKIVGGFAGDALIDFYERFLKPVGVWVFGEGLPRFIDAITNGLASINWERINDALKKLWDALAPFAINVGEGLLWFWEKVLVPLGSWTMSNVVPLFLEILAAAIDVLNEAIEVLAPGAVWLFDNFLRPIASWTGGVIIKVLEWLRDVLIGISDWIEKNKQKFIDLFQTIEPLLSVFVDNFVKSLDIIKAFVDSWASAIEKVFFGVLDFLTGVFAGDWRQAWDGIKQIFQGVIDAISAIFKLLWDSLVDSAKTGRDLVMAAWSMVATWFSTTVVEPVKGFFGGLWDGIKNGAATAWEGIKNTFKTVSGWLDKYVIEPVTKGFKGFMNGLIGFAEGFVNFFIRGINKIVDGINSLSFDLPEVLGGGHVGFSLSYVPEMKLPRLATGAVIPANREFMAVLGDQKNGRNLEAPEGLIRQIIREEMGGMSGQSIVGIEFTGNLAQLGRVLKPVLDKENQRKGIKLVRGTV